MVTYTLTTTNEGNTSIIELSGIVDPINISLIKVSDSSIPVYTYDYIVTTPTFTVTTTEDDVLKITLTDSDTLEEVDVYVRINYRAIVCGNSINKCDVNSILCGIDKRNSKLVDSLNRVVIANFRLENYDEAVEGLVHISNLCSNNNCNCSC